MAKAADTLIRTGCVINGRTLKTRKRLAELKWCMKCNRFTSRHVAKTCKADHDTCAKCSGDHREVACMSAVLACVNCKGDHTASDRACPRYLKEVAKIRDRVPDNKYPYYPEADDPSTWVQDVDSPPNTQQDTGTAATNPKTTGSWRTVERKRGRRLGATTTTTQGSTAAPTQGLRPAGSNQPRVRSRSWSRLIPGIGDGPATRPSSPLRQQTLHEVAPGGILPGTPRPWANTASAATPSHPNA
jgi:hypothetical protein